MGVAALLSPQRWNSTERRPASNTTPGPARDDRPWPCRDVPNRRKRSAATTFGLAA